MHHHGAAEGSPILSAESNRNTMHGVKRIALTWPLLVALAACTPQSPSPTVVPSPEPTPTASPVTELDFASTGWWRLGWIAELSDDAPPSLRAGTLDGRVTAEIPTGDLWQDQLGFTGVRGPVNGLVLYGHVVEAGVEFHLVSAITGVDRVVGQLPGSVADVVLSPDGSLVWLETTGHPGVWRRDPESGAVQQLLAAVQVARFAPGIVLAAPIQPRTQLAMSADGRWVAALWCGLIDCELRALNLEEKSLVRAGFAAPVDLGGFGALGVAVGSHCVSLPGGRVEDGGCGQPDQFAWAADMARNAQAGVELPSGWLWGTRLAAGAEPMSFELEAVALPPNDEPIVLDALGHFAGNG